MRSKIALIISFCLVVTGSGCSVNVLENFAVKTSNEALYNDAYSAMNAKDYTGALTKIALMTGEFPALRKVVKLKAEANAGLCGLEFLPFVQAMKARKAERYLAPELVEGNEIDIRTALDFLSENYPHEPITFAGFSFGTRFGTPIAMNDDRIVRLISIGTPVDKYGFEFLRDCEKPILFVHGDNDEFGSEPAVRALFDSLEKTEDKELVVFKNCGHFFDEHLAELRKTIADWTAERI